MESVAASTTEYRRAAPWAEAAAEEIARRFRMKEVKFPRLGWTTKPLRHWIGASPANKHHTDGLHLALWEHGYRLTDLRAGKQHQDLVEQYNLPRVSSQAPKPRRPKPIAWWTTMRNDERWSQVIKDDPGAEMTTDAYGFPAVRKQGGIIPGERMPDGKLFEFTDPITYLASRRAGRRVKLRKAPFVAEMIKSAIRLDILPYQARRHRPLLRSFEYTPYPRSTVGLVFNAAYDTLEHLPVTQAQVENGNHPTYRNTPVFEFSVGYCIAYLNLPNDQGTRRAVSNAFKILRAQKVLSKVNGRWVFAPEAILWVSRIIRTSESLGKVRVPVSESRVYIPISSLLVYPNQPNQPGPISADVFLERARGQPPGLVPSEGSEPPIQVKTSAERPTERPTKGAECLTAAEFMREMSERSPE